MMSYDRMGQVQRDAVEVSVSKKLAEILARPEVTKEIDDVAETALRAQLPDVVKEVAKHQLESYNAAFKPMVKKAVDAWVESHREEIGVMAEEAAFQAMQDPTVFQEAAKYQLAAYIGKIANDAVIKATLRQAKKTAKVKKV